MKWIAFLVLGLFWVLPLTAEEIGVWETRGDAFFQAKRFDRSLTAYKTALGADPSNPRIMTKYQRAFLEVMATQTPEEQSSSRGAPGGSSGSTGFSSGLSRMGGISRMGGESRSHSESSQDQREPGPEEGMDSSLMPEEGGVPELDASVDGESGSREGQPEKKKTEEELAKEKEELEELRWRRERERRMLDRIPALSRLGRTPSQGRKQGDSGPRIYGGSQTVEVDEVRQGNESGDQVQQENSVVETTKTRIQNVVLSFEANALHIRGTIENISNGLIRLPRVYCRIYDEAGILRGRNFSYLSPGRNVLARGKTKKFDVIFRGYTGTVSSYQFEVIP